ncbi:NAD(P)H-dependent oxidoreductase [Pseudoalteromonas undina]|uniref:NAD(P)H-dependent oxidoreductase n=1 Tax=Pseudoalteromonas undina TaxID=43660 RepID=A0ACC6R863_9GAMM
MKFLVFLGTIRDSTPPKPARLGERVAKSCLECLNERYSEHEFELIDALDFPSEDVFKPHFAYAKSQAPEHLTALADKISQADGYIMVSPEYNHSMSPALADLLNHFGSSLFSYKPSAIVTYSAGLRAAISLRTFLSELGCLPVSAMIHVPKAQERLNNDGSTCESEDKKSWFNYYSRTFSQLMWWAQACSQQTKRVDPHSMLKSFKTDPSERNAP